MIRWKMLTLGLLLVTSPGLRAHGGEPPCSGTPDAVEGITARELGAHMRFLASDLMRGRDTASEEIRIAAEYLASQLEALGANPAGDRDTYFQRFPLEQVTPDAEGTRFELILDRGESRRTIQAQLGVDFEVLSPRGMSPGEVEAPVVFASYGLVDGESEVNDYEGLHVADCFVLVLSGSPEVEGESGSRLRRAASLNAKAENAESRGALAVLVVDPPGIDANRSSRFEEGVRGFGRPSLGLPDRSDTMPRITLSNALRDVVLTDIELGSGPVEPRVLDGVRARFRYAANREAREDRNVVGYFPGSDPDRAKEVVIFSAHYDHVGVNADGEIFNGSDDNASGTSALLELAEAFGEGPRPARSVAFLWVSGEEKGLLGSEWFADHVSLPEGHTIIADINLDMISRNDGTKVGITPSPDHEDYNSLVPTAQMAAEAEELEIQFDIDRYYRRTDSYNFAKKGIPSIFFFSGVHDDYHKPTDDVEKADFHKAARITRAAYRLGWQVAQDSNLPKKLQPEDREVAEVASSTSEAD